MVVMRLLRCAVWGRRGSAVATTDRQISASAALGCVRRRHVRVNTIGGMLLNRIHLQHEAIEMLGILFSRVDVHHTMKVFLRSTIVLA
jgi:hypothetical protein